MLVLGIDAAWTATEPSGVALITGDELGWRLLSVASSYDDYLAPPASDIVQRPRGSVPSPESLLERSASLGLATVDLVAIDMPLSLEAITSRRTADNEVSRAYGGRKCSTHTPSSIRPGTISDTLRSEFAHLGYDLLTSGRAQRGLIEVYPHPALVELADARERLRYKTSKLRKYWPVLAAPLRREALFDVWRQIVERLDGEVAGTADALTLPAPDSPTWKLKAFEDALDAIVCAWAGACATTDGCIPFGDRTAAIWIPRKGFRLGQVGS